MKLQLISSLFILSISCLSSYNSPNSEINKAKKQVNSNDNTLTVLNCADYIDKSLIYEFQEETGCKVEYITFTTLEEMYNKVTLNKNTYDLLCPSEYMIQKLVNEDLIIPLDRDRLSTYYQNGSQQIISKLEKMKTSNGKTIADYCAGYMWGTMGLVYDPNYYTEEEVKSWDILWNENHRKQASIKNSMRDTYVVGILHAYKEELKQARNEYLKNPNDADTIKKYNDTIQSIFDLHDEENIEKVKQELISLRSNIYGFEVDSGKNDIIDGKIKMNLAWSGDAVYSIYSASEEANKELRYSVPEEGSNIWYDGWVLPKGSNEDLAYKFINFLSRSENATRNMIEIGYTPFITGEYIFNQVANEYGAVNYDSQTTYTPSNEDEELFASVVKYNDKFYQCIQECSNKEPSNSPDYFIELNEGDEYYPLEKEYDLSYYFDGTLTEGKDAIIYPYKHKENKLYTQYPNIDTINRCAFMNDFGEDNNKVIIMWGQVKASTNMTPYYTILILAVAFIPCYFIIKHIKEKSTLKYANKRNNSISN